MKRKDQFTSLVPEATWEAAQKLSAAFQWKESAEGYAYWEAIHARLVEIAKSAKG